MSNAVILLFENDAWTLSEQAARTIDTRNDRKAIALLVTILIALTVVSFAILFPAITTFVSEAVHTFLDTSTSITLDTPLPPHAHGGKTG